MSFPDPAHQGSSVVLDAPEAPVASGRENGRELGVEQTKRLLQHLAESQSLAHVGSWERTLGPEERLFWSDEMFSIWGRPPGSAPPSVAALLETIHPEDRARFVQVVRAALERREPYEVEYRIRLDDGSEKVVVARGIPAPGPDGQPGRIAGVAMDVTALRRTEAELEFQARLLASATDSIIVVDLDGRISFANEAAWRTRGYTREELLAMDVRSLDIPEYAEKVGERIAEILEKRHAVFESEHVCKDGHVMPVEVNSRVLVVGGRTCFLSAIRDISRRKNAEAAAKRANEELREWVAVLERRNNQISLLAEMARALQACRAVDEAWTVCGGFAQHLFKVRSGALLAVRGAGRPLETVFRWGGSPREIPPIPPEDCWALRLERSFAECGTDQALTCRHNWPAKPPVALCVPVGGREEPFGVVRLEPGPEEGDTFSEGLRKLAETVAEQLSLSVANLRLREQLREQATHDPLTGLYNRWQMEEILTRELRRASRQDATVGILMLDLDRFKEFNDARGHEAGDDLLRALGAFLLSHVRAEDTVFRYGGEEFVVVLPGASAEEARTRAEQLRGEIRELTAGGDPVTVSIGAAIFPDSASNSAELLRAADVALYRAKANGRDRVEMLEAV